MTSEFQISIQFLFLISVLNIKNNKRLILLVVFVVLIQCTLLHLRIKEVENGFGFIVRKVTCKAEIYNETMTNSSPILVVL